MVETHLSSRYPWFEVVQGRDLEQGDILAGCPVFRPSFKDTEGEASARITVNRRTGVIVTQSCDLVTRAEGRCHCKEVLFCPVYSRGELANDPVFGRKAAWEEARKGRLPGYHVLNRCELAGHEREFLLVDFSQVFTVDVSIVRELAAGQGPRLRLLPPYREHLSQAFARFFMRVGLPVDVPPFC
jgi:hypothetical protein